MQHFISLKLYKCLHFEMVTFTALQGNYNFPSLLSYISSWPAGTMFMTPALYWTLYSMLHFQRKLKNFKFQWTSGTTARNNSITGMWGDLISMVSWRRDKRHNRRQHRHIRPKLYRHGPWLMVAPNTAVVDLAQGKKHNIQYGSSPAKMTSMNRMHKINASNVVSNWKVDTYNTVEFLYLEDLACTQSVLFT